MGDNSFPFRRTTDPLIFPVSTTPSQFVVPAGFFTSGAGKGVTLTTTNTAPLSYIVPAGHYVRLVSTVTGTGSASIVSQTEEVLG